MKFKHAILIAFAAIIATIIGALFKLQHWPGAAETMLVAMILMIAALISLIYTIARQK